MSSTAAQPGTSRTDAGRRPAPGSTLRTLIVIVNYKTPDVTIDCLRSLAGQVEAARASVVVVDNASGDGSVEKIRAACAAAGWGWATAAPSERNAGFGAGNNVGVRFGLAMAPPPDLFFLLNPDTVVPDGALAKIVDEMERTPDCAILGVSMRGPAGNLNSNAFRFPSALSELEEGARLGALSRLLARWRVVRTPPDEPAPAEWVSGAAMVTRRAVWERIGFMDEGFFLYFEEIDFCRRARDAGFSVRYLPGVDIVHLEGVATECGHRGGAKRERKRRPRWWYESRRRYFVKHHGWATLLLADALWGLGRATLVVRHALGLGGDVSIDPLRYARDLLGGDLRAVGRGVARALRPRSGSAA